MRLTDLEAESKRLAKKRYVARMDLDDGHRLSMNNRARVPRHDQHDVIDTKHGTIAWRGDDYVDGDECRRAAAALNRGKRPTPAQRCPHCNGKLPHSRQTKRKRK